MPSKLYFDVTLTAHWTGPTEDTTHLHPFTFKSDQFQISPAASPENITTQYGELGFHSLDEKGLYYQSSVQASLIHFPLKRWENALFEIGSEKVNHSHNSEKCIRGDFQACTQSSHRSCAHRLCSSSGSSSRPSDSKLGVLPSIPGSWDACPLASQWRECHTYWWEHTCRPSEFPRHQWSGTSFPAWSRDGHTSGRLGLYSSRPDRYRSVSRNPGMRLE